MIKKCTKCKLDKSFLEYSPHKGTSTGLQPSCRDCRRLAGKVYRQKNIERVRMLQRGYTKTYMAKNYEKVREMQKKWQKLNKEHLNQWQRQRRETSIEFKLGQNMARALRGNLKGKKAGRRWETLVGYTIEDLIEHLESRFEPWMTWENYGKWHVDHIVPKSHFKYGSTDDPEFKKCWALDNLQPLDGIENMRKRDRIITLIDKHE